MRTNERAVVGLEIRVSVQNERGVGQVTLGDRECTSSALRCFFYRILHRYSPRGAVAAYRHHLIGAVPNTDHKLTKALRTQIFNLPLYKRFAVDWNQTFGHVGEERANTRTQPSC